MRRQYSPTALRCVVLDQPCATRRAHIRGDRDAPNRTATLGGRAEKPRLRRRPDRRGLRPYAERTWARADAQCGSAPRCGACSSAAPPHPSSSCNFERDEQTELLTQPPAWPEPLAIARSMLALGTPAALAFSMAVRNWKLPAGSAPPRAATVTSRPSRVNTAPRLASTTALVRLIWAHLLWPAIGGCGENGGRVALRPLAASAGGVNRRR